MATKKSIFEEHLKKWLAAKNDRKMRGEIRSHICFVTGAHPKSISRSFRRVQLRDPARESRRGRKRYYTPDVIAALRQIWDIGGEPCGENLHGIIQEYVQILLRDGYWKHGVESTNKLLKMSLGTVKKRVAGFPRESFPTKGKGTTKPGAIHSLIPVRSGPWGKAPTGTMQIDTVAHCGDFIAGAFVYTVNATDVATLWGDRRAQWNKGQEVTVQSMEAMNCAIPFPVTEWHPDSGSEFINWHCKGWCEARGQALTRSRPSHKNDNCFVEERNGHVVRRWVGNARFDVREAVQALNAIYDVLTPYMNHFVTSCRTIKKEKIGSQWKITREKKALTPYRRVLERTDVSKQVKAELKRQHDVLSPLILREEIDLRLKKMFTLLMQHGKPAPNRELR
jgi:transposase InsO family protein